MKMCSMSDEKELQLEVEKNGLNRNEEVSKVHETEPLREENADIPSPPKRMKFTESVITTTEALLMETANLTPALINVQENGLNENDEVSKDNVSPTEPLPAENANIPPPTEIVHANGLNENDEVIIENGTRTASLPEETANFPPTTEIRPENGLNGNEEVMKENLIPAEPFPEENANIPSPTENGQFTESILHSAETLPMEPANLFQPAEMFQENGLNGNEEISKENVSPVEPLPAENANIPSPTENGQFTESILHSAETLPMEGANLSQPRKIVQENGLNGNEEVMKENLVPTETFPEENANISCIENVEITESVINTAETLPIEGANLSPPTENASLVSEEWEKPSIPGHVYVKAEPSESSAEDKKPMIHNKSSIEILSELFSTFNADPPVIVKKEKDDSKKEKKGKKKHKHKHKKHKSKKRKRSSSQSSISSETSPVDLQNILINPENSDVTEIYLKHQLKKIKTQLDVMETNEVQKEEKKKSSKKKKRKHDDSDEDERVRKRSKSHKSSKPEILSKYINEPGTSRDRRHFDDLREKIDRNRDDYQYKYDYGYKDDYYHRNREYYDDRRYRHKEQPYSERYFREDKCRDRDRHRHSRHQSRDKENQQENYIDKKKLLEIARKNAIQMMKSGNLPGALTLGPQSQEKVIAAIRSGGKTVEELTEFCKTLSKKEEMMDLSSFSGEGSSDEDHPFHHPFQIRDRPLTINIKNAVPLPVKSNQERASELRIQFPVSSGQQHRKTENEWVPVSPKKIESTSKTQPTIVQAPAFTVTGEPGELLAIAGPSDRVTPPPGPQIYPTESHSQNQMDTVDIAAMVSQRLSAIKKLHENPNDVQAISQMYHVQKEVNTWAESKQNNGQFTGSTGVQILSQAELASGYQAWARKDQLQTAAPLSGGMGMHLLQKMGWKPGEGLGKEKSGTLEPLLLEVKLDKKGIVAKEEQGIRAKKTINQEINVMLGKHPVSLLGEYASKRKIGAPEYLLDFECGPDHKKNFLFKVVLNGVEYKPNVASGNKKDAKALAATVCLQQLGLLP